eukprot:Plantae.Rhodophyta-Hildenbrandia_rubra.ctg6948.p1 GENE.Plantae.Rhodophyta-Hildenbrandia_rubra.ctg6948~~Plantae.Rhodophyta-Hildenbrandia_rubra.ctg6948.p1  ORF type:complete len:483 (+),score=76.07 Plantae.Rhodophyta-Hildenbrandia_rubra.ctg6948:1394-2842(+)
MTAGLNTSEAEFDVIVVGAGVAGGALATCLARDGRRVVCIERHLWTSCQDTENTSEFHEPDRIVGELLQPGGYEALCRLGLKDALEGIDAQKVMGYGIFLYDKRMCIGYQSGDEKRKGVVSGRSFHNGRFLKRLREIMKEEENVEMVEGNVVSLVREGSEVDEKVVGVKYRERGEVKVVRAKLTIACDGCASNLRRKARPDAKYQIYSQFVGLVLENCELPFPNHGHVVLADPAPMLFYPISSTEVRCLVDIPSTVQGSFEHHMINVLAPQVPDIFREAFLAAIKSGKSKTMPNRVMPSQPAVTEGALLLGDSFNMRHPLTGGGMTVALSDVTIIRDVLKDVTDLGDTKSLSARMDEFYKRRQPLSSTINILANALYSVFCATDDPALLEMREACFDYLSAGGRMSGDPVSMLGGLKPYPYLLVVHFFAVALYGCGRILLPFPSLERVRKSWSLFRSAFNIVKPLIDAEGVKPLSWIPISHL